eukprot:jgi/Phyca11/504334/fgenesh2_kg.PHYCAscaffold_7_\
MFASTKITTRLASAMTTRSFTASAPKNMKVNPNIFGCVENELGLRKFLEDRGHEFVVTSDKDGDNSEFARNLHDADVVISQPFWPAYITRERIAKAPKLKLAITAGIGSDHVDLAAACDRNITVAEVTGSNVVSVAEHVVMMILSLVRNYMPAYKQVVDGQWDIAAIANHAHDLENKHVGVVAAGRIGLRVLRRLHPFDVKLHYTDKARYAAGTKEILERFFDGKAQRPEYLIAEGGKVTSPSYTHGNATSGSL